MSMTKPEWCHRSTMLCNSEQCVLFVKEWDQCFDEIEKEYKMNQMNIRKTTTSPAPSSTLVADAMKGQPDLSQIEWMVKGNKDARDTDPFAYAFVFKYDRDAGRVTDELRPEVVELYNYLKANDNTLVIGQFTYSLNKEGSLFGRNKAKD